MNAIRRFIDRRLGRGEAAITVPVLDGPLMPNAALDEAGIFAELAGADNIVLCGKGLVASSGGRVLRLGPAGQEGEELFAFDNDVSALACGKGMLAIGLDGKGVTIRGGSHDGRTYDMAEGPRHPTSLAFLDADTLLVTEGASSRRARDWRRDLMEKGASGSLWRLSLASGEATKILGGLRWAGGVAATGSQKVWLAESWRHRILSVDLTSGRLEPALEHLPAYPARIAPAVDAGFWLSFFSVRNQLVEFILREPAYCRRMLAEGPEPFWMAPALASGLSFSEPMQGSQLRRMGVTKPFAETRSYGLVVHCSAQMKPLRSFHSRADGFAHGCVAAVEHGDDLFVASKGHGKVLRLAGAAREA
jgi:hypothetical protein